MMYKHSKFNNIHNCSEQYLACTLVDNLTHVILLELKFKLKVQSVNVNSTLENHGIALNLYRKNLREPICLSDCKVYLHKQVI